MTSHTPISRWPSWCSTPTCKLNGSVLPSSDYCVLRGLGSLEGTQLGVIWQLICLTEGNCFEQGREIAIANFEFEMDYFLCCIDRSAILWESLRPPSYTFQLGTQSVKRPTWDTS